MYRRLTRTFRTLQGSRKPRATACSISLAGPFSVWTVAGLGAAGWSTERDGQWASRDRGKKPCGNDLKFGQALNAEIIKHARESDLPDDHFSRQRTAAEIMALRFEGISSRSGNEEHIDTFRLPLPKAVGVEQRGKFMRNRRIAPNAPNHVFHYGNDGDGAADLLRFSMPMGSGEKGGSD